MSQKGLGAGGHQDSLGPGPLHREIHRDAESRFLGENTEIFSKEKMRSENLTKYLKITSNVFMFDLF